MGHSILGYKFDALAVSLTKAAPFFAFAAAMSPVIALTQTIIGSQAQKHLEELGHELTAGIKSMAEEAKVDVALKYQSKFAQHVYKFASMRIHQTVGASCASAKASATASDYFLIYHPGSDWHGEFYDMIKEKPLVGLIGVSNKLEILILFAEKVRKEIGPQPTIHILLPSAHMYIITDKIVIPESLGPLSIEGELHYSGEPYTFIDIANDSLNRIAVYEIGLSKQPFEETVGRQVAYHSAAAGAGIAGVLAGSGGVFFGSAVGIGVVESLGLVGAVALGGPVVWAIGVGALVAGVGAGTASAIATKNKVRDNFQKEDDIERKRQKEEAVLKAQKQRQNRFSGPAIC